MKIRTIVICLIQRRREILVFEGYDAVKDEVFYRPLGGGIEFGETAAEAAQREMQEEIGVEIDNLSYLATFENIFTSNGKPSHEIVFLLSASFKDKSLYAQDTYIGDDNGSPFTAQWVDVDDFVTGKKIIYPEGLIDYVNKK